MNYPDYSKLFSAYVKSPSDFDEQQIVAALDLIALGEADVSQGPLIELLSICFHEEVLVRAIQVTAHHTPWGKICASHYIDIVRNYTAGNNSSLFSFIALSSVWENIDDAYKKDAVLLAIDFLANATGTRTESKEAYKLLLKSVGMHSEFMELGPFVKDWSIDQGVLVLAAGKFV